MTDKEKLELIKKYILTIDDRNSLKLQLIKQDLKKIIDKH